jgi:hypothetical protein
VAGIVGVSAGGIYDHFGRATLCSITAATMVTFLAVALLNGSTLRQPLLVRDPDIASPQVS